jgi:hypothetical protein
MAAARVKARRAGVADARFPADLRTLLDLRMGDQVVEEVGAADGVDVVLVKIGAKVIAHARYTVFQMAEVAVPRDMFRRVLDTLPGRRCASGAP